MSSVEPEYRLRNLRRRLRDMLMSRRLAADPERSGVVELRDFGRQCDALAAFARASVDELGGARGPQGASARRLAEEVELAARGASLLEALPKTPRRVERQCALLEEPLEKIELALEHESVLEEPPVLVSLSALARRERELFEPFLELTGRIEDAPPGRFDRAAVQAALRRALLDHADTGEGPIALVVTRDGTLRCGDLEIATEPAGGDAEDADVSGEDAGDGKVARSPHEPPEVKKALDLHAIAPDPELKAFLLVKAVDEALFALLAPRLAQPALAERARALPRRPGKRFTVRPEAVRRPVAGWDAAEAARGVEKLAARRAGPDWARLPKGAYLLRLFESDDDALAGDLLALGPALRRMEKGEPVEDTGPRARRALRKLLGLLG